LAGNDVGENRDGVRLVRTPERVQVRAVGRWILCDQRSLAMGRCGAALGPECGGADDGCCGEQQSGCHGDPSMHLNSSLDLSWGHRPCSQGQAGRFAGKPIRNRERTTAMEATASAVLAWPA